MRYHIRVCDITYLHCGVTSILYYLVISQQSIYSYNKIEYHIIINDNFKQFTISQSLKSCGCGKDFKNFTIYGHGGYMLPEQFQHFLSNGKEWPSYHNLLRLPKQILPCRKKDQDQPKVTIWTYLVELKFPKLLIKFKGQDDI